jgi:hypothetical protein
VRAPTWGEVVSPQSHRAMEDTLRATEGIAMDEQDGHRFSIPRAYF